MKTAENREHNARAQAFYGSFWTLIGFGGSQFIRLVGNLVLARLLFPEAFGLMALVNVFMHGLQMFSDFGIGPAVIQNPRGDEPEFRNTAWTLQIIRGLSLWLIAIALAWPVARFYAGSHPNAMQLLQLLPVIGFTAFLGGFTSSSLYIFNRKMKIATVTLIELIPQCVSFLVMVCWALFINRTVWALAIGGIVYSIVRLGLTHLLEHDYHDRLRLDPAISKELIRFGGWIFASTIVSFLVTHLDKIVLGRLLSLAELGIYSIAMTFARLGMQITTRLSAVVLFPLLTKRQHRPERLMALCRRGRRLVLLTGGAVSLAFALGAPFFFQFLYDERYHAAGPLARWLALYVWSWILVATLDRVPLALGQTRTLFKSNLINVCSMTLAVPGYLLAGLPGFVLGMTAAQVFALIYITANLPCQRGKIVLQSVSYTCIGIVYFPIALFLVNWSQRVLTNVWLSTGVLLAAAALPLLMALLVVYQEIRKKKATDAT